MKKYKNLSGKSNVKEYEIGDDFIKVVFFGTNRVYTYSYRKAGVYRVDKMKAYAEAGEGLNSYIKTCADKLYD